MFFFKCNDSKNNLTGFCQESISCLSGPNYRGELNFCILEAVKLSSPHDTPQFDLGQCPCRGGEDMDKLELGRHMYALTAKVTGGSQKDQNLYTELYIHIYIVPCMA